MIKFTFFAGLMLASPQPVTPAALLDPQFCGAIQQWKTLMVLEHPTHDRRLPEASRLCLMPDF